MNIVFFIFLLSAILRFCRRVDARDRSPIHQFLFFCLACPWFINREHDFAVRRWPCAHSDIATQLAAANEDRYLAKWIDAHKLSPKARAVLDAARVLYREFYDNITHTPWMDWKIETWDVGYYQIRNAMKSISDLYAPTDPVESLRNVHDALRAKLLPQVYSLGFLNPDVVYFE